MDFGSVDTAIILALIVIVIFLGSMLWRLHSAADTISKRPQILLSAPTNRSAPRPPQGA
jgi:hypothetical protein